MCRPPRSSVPFWDIKAALTASSGCHRGTHIHKHVRRRCRLPVSLTTARYQHGVPSAESEGGPSVLVTGASDSTIIVWLWQHGHPAHSGRIAARLTVGPFSLSTFLRRMSVAFKLVMPGLAFSHSGSKRWVTPGTLGKDIVQAILGSFSLCISRTGSSGTSQYLGCTAAQ